MNNLSKNGKLVVFILSSLVFVGIVIGVFSLVSRAKSPEIKAPSVALLELDGETLIISAATGFPDELSAEQTSEQFVYCLNVEGNPDSCNWENFDDFKLEEERTYYVFVKSLSTEKVSAPETFTYEKIDFKSLKL